MKYAAASGQASRKRFSATEYFMTSPNEEMQKICVSKSGNKIVDQRSIGLSPVARQAGAEDIGLYPQSNFPKSPDVEFDVECIVIPPPSFNKNGFWNKLKGNESNTESRTLPVPKIDADLLTDIQNNPAEDQPAYEVFEKVLESLPASTASPLVSMIQREEISEVQRLVAEQELTEAKDIKPSTTVHAVSTEEKESSEDSIPCVSSASPVRTPIICITREAKPPKHERILLEVGSFILRCSKSMYLDLDFLYKYQISKSQHRRISAKFYRIRQEKLIYQPESSILPADVEARSFEGQVIKELDQQIYYEVKLQPLLYTNELDDELLLGLHGFLGCFTFNSEFLQSQNVARSEAKRCKIMQAQKVFFPVCVDMHWYGIFYFHESKTAVLFDSFNQSSTNSEEYKLAEALLKEIFDISDITPVRIKIPQQRNAYDCGYAMFLIAFLLSHGIAKIESQIDRYDTRELITLRYYLLSWFVQNSAILPQETATISSDDLEIVDV